MGGSGGRWSGGAAAGRRECVSSAGTAIRCLLWLLLPESLRLSLSVRWLSSPLTGDLSPAVALHPTPVRIAASHCLSDVTSSARAARAARRVHAAADGSAPAAVSLCRCGLAAMTPSHSKTTMTGRQQRRLHHTAAIQSPSLFSSLLSTSATAQLCSMPLPHRPPFILPAPQHLSRLPALPPSPRCSAAVSGSSDTSAISCQ